MRRTASRACALIAGFVALGSVGLLSAAPSVYPKGTTLYQPDKAWNGYTVFVLPETGAVLIDMNGKTVRKWDQFAGLGGGPVRMLPGGHVMGAIGTLPPHQESVAVAEYDWNNAPVWQWDHAEQVKTREGSTQWAARQHHDWQRADFPAGYYSPGPPPRTGAGRTLVLSHRSVVNDKVSSVPLEDDTLYELSPEGAVLWEWHANEHIDELGFAPEARDTLHNRLQAGPALGSVDWLHLNAATYVGPNRWYDAGDTRFHPDNVIISSRQANIIAIVDRKGAIVWRLGPDYRATEAMQALGQIIGQHHPHLIPKGLPGAGNLLVFDNGGAAGYGFTHPGAPQGRDGVGRYSSRVLEIDPVAVKKVWEYSLRGQESYRFFSHYVSSAQRLPNGNTLITEGADGRLFEVTKEGEIVWEYVSPYFGTNAPNSNRVYRAYRLPYDWVPQLPRPKETAVKP